MVLIQNVLDNFLDDIITYVRNAHFDSAKCFKTIPFHLVNSCKVLVLF